MKKSMIKFNLSKKLRRWKSMAKLCFLLLSFCTSTAFAQQDISITGAVTDRGEPLPGVSVIVKGTTTGVVTDINGNYRITVPNTSAVLVFRYLGYTTTEVPVGTRSVIDVNLAEDFTLLDEVVVIGYGTVSRRDVTTAVASVSTRDLDERPIIQAVQAIQGRAAGVNVFQPSGTPGAEMVIRVRGTTSFIGSNSPLYVVDGVPVDNLNFLSPNDIASMQILKDASSAAIYGSRAANGVVLITTKQAGAGAKVALSAQYGFTNVSNRIESLNARQYKDLMDEMYPGVIPDDAITDKTDWFNEVYTTGITQNYQLQVSDGNERLRYFVSSGYQRENGILHSAFFERYNLRANIDNQVRKWLNFGLNVSYSDRAQNGVRTGSGSNRGGVVLSVVNLPTAVEIMREDGLYNRNFFGFDMVNPIEAMENGKNNKNRENRLIASGNATITFAPELNFRTQFTLDRRNVLNTSFIPPIYSEYVTDFGEGRDIRNMNTVLVFDNVLTWKKSYNSLHNVEVMLGSSWTDSDYTASRIVGTHYRDGNIQTLNAANRISWNDTRTTASQWGIMSFFGRASYNFDSKYLFTFNMRQDGSSRLHPDHRWGAFPSFSAAWRLSSENFMQDFTWLDDLKIRGGWGQTGNQSGINEYAYLQRYNIRRLEWWVAGQTNAVPDILPDNLRTKDLKWETTSQTNIGLDITALRNRLTFAADWYYKHTTDMLMEVRLLTGPNEANSIIRNEGEMTNRGFEFTVNSRNLTGDFQWNTDLVISFNKNKLKSLRLAPIYTDAETTDAFHQTRIVRNQAGRSLGGFWGYISDGVDPETGLLMYRDINEDGRITDSDLTYIGDPNPKFTYGVTNSFSYKNFNLNVFIQGSVGNDIFNASKVEVMGMYDQKNQSVNQTFCCVVNEPQRG
jgi:TonB-linked SusC/RagA family outer membrane protein